VMPDDDEDALAARILEAEHACYPLAVRLLAENRVHILDEHALVDMQDAAAAPLIHPQPE